MLWSCFGTAHSRVVLRPAAISHEALSFLTEFILGVANDDFVSHEYVSQEYETQYGDDNLDMDDEGFVAKGRSGNYTNAEDVLICTAWKKVSQDASVGSDQTVNTYW